MPCYYFEINFNAIHAYFNKREKGKCSGTILYARFEISDGAAVQKRSSCIHGEHIPHDDKQPFPV